jgi:transposase InsO family protein
VIKPHLLQFGVRIGRDRLHKILKDNDMIVKRKRRYSITTDSNHSYKVYKDLTVGLELSGPNQLWVSDITYIRTWKGFAYLSLITDAYSRKIVGYHLSQSLKARGTLIALEKAIATLDPGQPAPIHHSDRGVQYCCDAYVERLKEAGITISMTQNGSPYENAMAERINGILKSEFELNKTFRSYSGTIDPLQRAIDVYNRLRPHLSIDNLTPNEAHKKTGPIKRRWKPRKRNNKDQQEQQPNKDPEALSTGNL